MSEAIDYTIIGKKKVVAMVTNVADLVGMTNLLEDPKQIYVDFQELSEGYFV